MSADLLHRPAIDWELIASKPLLRIHAALILGICDPIPMPSPMSEEEAAWVREHAWTPALRRIEDEYPYGFYRWCSCQHGTCWNCLNNRCDICVHRQRGGPDIDTDAPSSSVTDRNSFVVARIVLRDGQRPCRWTCKCPCPKTGPTPTQAPRSKPPRTVQRRKRDDLTPAGQLDLLGAAS